MTNKNIREQITDFLVTIEKEKTYAQLLLKQMLVPMEGRDKSFVTEVVYGTLKYQLRLDYIINYFSKTPVHKMKPFIRQLMRMSVYQMFYLDKVPTSAVINEAVKIAKKRKFSNLSGFVNGVLRQIDRKRDEMIYPEKEKDLLSYLSVKYSIPTWILQEWLLAYSVDCVEQICASLNKRAEVCIRINSLVTTKEEVEQILTKENIILEPGKLLKEALYIHHVDNLQTMPSFKKGMWTVQDESAMLVAQVVSPQPGEHILDMCSAPGGKSLHMAELMQNKGKIISADVHEHKLELIEKNANRMQISIIHPVLQDGTSLRQEWIQAFDRVLLDAPCSGLGILKRKPDIRYHKHKEDLQAIVSLQKQLIQNAVKYVKEEGILVYSTCTISPQENEEMVKEIIKNFSLELCDIADTIPEVLKDCYKEKGMLQIYPFVADTDGFFIACFKKKRTSL